tara:strand:+ start:1436 stop:1891 length:456 start_codon:yes stop_codon:yes gene_type:complete
MIKMNGDVVKKINRRMIRKLIRESLDMQGNPMGTVGGQMAFLSGAYYEVVNSSLGGVMGRPSEPDEDDVLGAFEGLYSGGQHHSEFRQNLSQLGIKIHPHKLNELVNVMIRELERGSGRLGSLLIAAENRDLKHWSLECKELLMNAHFLVP